MKTQPLHTSACGMAGTPTMSYNTWMWTSNAAHSHIRHAHGIALTLAITSTTLA